MIDQERWYSISELMELGQRGITPYKSRSSWLSFIKSGKLTCLQKSQGKRKIFIIQGKDVLNHMSTMKHKIPDTSDL